MCVCVIYSTADHRLPPPSLCTHSQMYAISRNIIVLYTWKLELQMHHCNDMAPLGHIVNLFPCSSVWKSISANGVESGTPFWFWFLCKPKWNLVVFHREKMIKLNEEKIAESN